MLDTPKQELVRTLPDGEELVTEMEPPKSLAERHERTIEARGFAYGDSNELEERRSP